LLALKTSEEIAQPEPRTKFMGRDPTYHSFRKRRFVDNGSYHDFPSPDDLERQAAQTKLQKEKDILHQKSVREIIASAAAAADVAAKEEAAAIAEAKAKVDAAAEKAARKKEKSIKISLTPEEHEANKEKRLLKLIGAVVVKCMSKHSKSFDHDAFKKHAKEV
jgi:hypothetical protein